MKYLFIAIIRLYQLLVSPLIPASCIHRVSCSTFMLTVIKSHGIILGLFWGLQRIIGCNNYMSYKGFLSEKI